MTTTELRETFENATARSREIEAKYRSGQRMTRRDCLQLSACNRRLKAIGYELWLLAGKPADPKFEIFKPQPLDLTGSETEGVN